MLEAVAVHQTVPEVLAAVLQVLLDQVVQAQLIRVPVAEDLVAMTVPVIVVAMADQVL
jgi:hypothetical protein